MTWMPYVIIILYYCPFLIYFTRLYPAPGKRRIIAAVLTPVLLAAAYGALGAQNLGMLNMPVFTVVMTVGLWCMTGMNFLQSVYGGLICILSVYCTRGVVVSIGALALRQPVLTDTVYFTFGFIAFPVGVAGFIFLTRRVFPGGIIRTLLSTRSQLKQVIGYGIAALLNLTIMHSGRYISQHDIWYPVVTLTNYAVSFGVLLFAIHQSIRGTELLVSQERNQMLQQQYARQLAHYKSYQKHTESFRAFRHDYAAMMGTTKTLMRAGEIERAIQIIDAVYDEAQKRVRIHKQYSEHAVLDAMLHDLANLCEENEIRYSFQLFVPYNTGLTLVDAMRIFSNITTNAVEACIKLPVSERYIRIASSAEQQWVILEVTNPYRGEINMQNGKPVTTKAAPEAHGFGLRIVADIAEALDGFVLYDLGTEHRTFSVRVFLPQGNGQAAPSP